MNWKYQHASGIKIQQIIYRSRGLLKIKYSKHFCCALSNLDIVYENLLNNSIKEISETLFQLSINIWFDGQTK